MNGLAETSGADREALFALATSPRPVGLASKRAADLFVAALGIVLLAPFFIFCCVATLCFSPGPVLFRHERVGFNGRRFKCLKFRTMAVDRRNGCDAISKPTPMLRQSGPHPENYEPTRE